MTWALEAPWTVDSTFIADDGGVEFHAIRDKQGAIVASTWAGPNLEVAQLLAAAPALLAAVRKICSATDGIAVINAIAEARPLIELAHPARVTKSKMAYNRHRG
jgi:hypothetical protein